jgi:hypothetical protein
MSEAKTIFYKAWTGVEFTWRWNSEEHRLAAREFLERLLGGPASTLEGRDFFVLEHQHQYDSLVAFRSELERSERRGP